MIKLQTPSCHIRNSSLIEDESSVADLPRPIFQMSYYVQGLLYDI